MKLPVLKRDDQEKTAKKPGILDKKLLRRRVVIPVLACALAAAVALCAAGFLSIWAVERIGDAVRARRERR